LKLPTALRWSLAALARKGGGTAATSSRSGSAAWFWSAWRASSRISSGG